jgi:hypothetical protein
MPRVSIAADRPRSVPGASRRASITTISRSPTRYAPASSRSGQVSVGCGAAGVTRRNQASKARPTAGTSASAESRRSRPAARLRMKISSAAMISGYLSTETAPASPSLSAARFAAASSTHGRALAGRLTTAPASIAAAASVSMTPAVQARDPANA